MPLTRGLIIATAVSFLLHTVMQVWVAFPLSNYTGLLTGGVTPWTALQLVTHPLAWFIVPRSAGTLLIDLLVLWFALGAFEERFGGKATAILVAASTLGSGVLAVLVGLLARPDVIMGPTIWFLAGWAGLGWALRHAPINLLGLNLRGVIYVWVALVIVVLNFLTDPRVPTLFAELGAIGAGVGFVAWRKRRLPPARISSVVSLSAARKARDGKNKEWLN